MPKQVKQLFNWLKNQQLM